MFRNSKVVIINLQHDTSQLLTSYLHQI